MNRTLLALMLVLSSVASAQVEVVYPYNPDGNADSVISAPDLLDLLPIFGGSFTPEEITVNGEGLSTVLEEMQSVLDSLSTLTDGTTAFGEKVFLDFDSMKWTMDTWEAAVFNPMTDGILEIVPDEGEAGILSVLVIPEELDPCAAIYDDCNFPPWTFWYADDLSNYQYGTDYPLTIPVRQSELVFIGSGYDGAWNVKFIWTPFVSVQSESASSSGCADIDEDGICDFADACMGMEVSFQFGSSEMLMSALFAEAGEYPSANLTDMDLSGVCAPQVKLYDASLSGSNFSGANLRGAVLVDATANEIDLNHCDLSSASCISLHAMDASAISTDFSNADLYQAQFSNANCANSNFQGANLRSTNFTAANLSFCDFTDQDFTLTYLEGAQMESAILTGAVMNCLSVGCPSSLPDGYYCEPDPDCIYGGANDGYHRILAIE